MRFVTENADDDECSDAAENADQSDDEPVDGLDEASKTVPAKPKKAKAKRKQTQELSHDLEAPTVPFKKKRKGINRGGKADGTLDTTYTEESVLENWGESTDYGVSFRNMNSEERLAEVVVLNKGAAKGMKGLIKSKLLVKHYKTLVADKLRDHIIACRELPSAMFRAPPKTANLVTSDINFLSVGEWVEVDADRTPGFNSEGGIAVIIGVHDALADVK
jgi:hypothetical protein